MTLLQPLRVRFAPAPTGMMHLGNIRTALMNYLIAQQKQGTFILRIEDTDTERNFDPQATKIIEDLTWLSIDYTEGPLKGGPHAPYFQSQRADIYQEKLDELIAMGSAYRCFCSSEELEKKRQRQIALKQPPRYDRVCFALTKQESDAKATREPFIWRMHLGQTSTLTIQDLAHGPVTFDLKNFSDFPLTRQNGTVTFMFANFVDDMLMEVTCAIRGEDHLSNTAGQAALYKAFGATIPHFWHMPIICNIDGKKLSKRDFGFSLRDLKDSGFLPEAIINYLAIIGASYKDEIMSMAELITTLNFDHQSSTGQIKYDVEKLRWVNHKWISKLPISRITELCRPYLESAYPTVKNLDDVQLQTILTHFHKELVTLQDCVQLLAFYFDDNLAYDAPIAHTLVPLELLETMKNIVSKNNSFTDSQAFVDAIKLNIKEASIAPKIAFSFIRYGLMASPHGPGLKELIDMLGVKKAQDRLTALLTLV